MSLTADSSIRSGPLAESEFHFDYHDRLFDRREAAKKNKTAYRPCDHT
jgi:hypothetical protein